MLSSNSARQPSRVSCISNSCSCVRINNSRTHTTCLTHESTEAQTQTQSQAHAYANTPSQKGKTTAHDLDPESVAVGTEDQNASAQQSSSSLSATKPESSVVPESGPGISSTHATGQHSTGEGREPSIHTARGGRHRHCCWFDAWGGIIGTAVNQPTCAWEQKM